MEKSLVRLTARLFFPALAVLCTLTMAGIAAPIVRPAAPAPPPPLKPTAPPINVLIIALDEVGKVIGAGAVPLPVAPEEKVVAPAEPKAVEPKVETPIAPAAPIAPPPAITPARPAAAPVTTRAYAKTTPKNEDDLFKMEPEVREAVPIKKPTLPALPPPPAIIPMTPAVVPGETMAPLPLDTPPVRPPGPALSAAALLRRALASSGFTDVLSTSSDGVTIMRAITARRLTERVVEQLQSAMAQVIAAPATPVVAAPATPPEAAPVAEVQPGAAGEPGTPMMAEAMQPAIRAASRIGRTLGYRAVVVLAVLPRAAGEAPATATATTAPLRSADYALLITDVARRTADLKIVDGTGPDDLTMHQAAAETAAVVIDRVLRTWPEVAPEQRVQQIQNALTSARMALAQGDAAEAQDELNEVVALDPRRAEAYVLLGDVLQPNDPAGAAIAYRRATAIDARDGAAWSKLAIAFTIGPKPDWPQALQAGRSALATGYDSAALRIALAVTQFGRGVLFRKAQRGESADEAEADARRHLDKALELEPDNPQAARLLASQLMTQNRFREAIRALDRLVPLYPDDIELQTQYALALSGAGGRDEDAFVTWARIWKLDSRRQVPLPATQYRRVAEGFDQRVASVGKQAAQLTASVATGALPRETAWLQLARYKEDMAAADAAIKVIQPAPGRMSVIIHEARTLAADLMTQSLEAHQLYLETGQDIYRVRALDLYRNSINQLNAARTARG